MKLFRYVATVGAVSAALIGFAGLASAATTTDTASCPLVTTFMKQGLDNNKTEVAKLQFFLQDSQGADVTVNGVYDQKTEDAVKAFQKKYSDVILKPWGATAPSGAVYITTAKKINQLACADALILNGKELSVITNYKSGLAMADNHATVPERDSDEPTVTYTSAVAGPSMQSEDVPVQTTTAAAADASIAGKFWFFLKNLF